MSRRQRFDIFDKIDNIFNSAMHIIYGIYINWRFYRVASNNKLYRNFIILQEDERGYSNASDKALSGYSKIESRAETCKVSFYAQNLKKDTDDYHMILICCKKDCKQIIDLGKIVISDSGKGEVTKEYDASNIGGLGVSFDKICGAALAKMKDGIPIYVMCGFLNSEQPTDNWKNYKVVKCNEHKQTTTEKKPKKDEGKDYKKTDKKPEKKVEKCEEICEHKKRDEDEKPLEISSVSKETKDNIVEEVPYVPTENLRGKFDEYEEQIEAVKEFDPDVSEIRGSIGEYFEAVADGFQRCKDKYKEVKYTKWYKVPVNDLYEMCNMSNYNKYTLAYYPMLNYYPYIKKHGYFMLGYKCDSEGNLKYIVYGVPGKKDKDEQPYDGKTGFVTWVKDKDVDDVGCWLMFYDYKNSTVVVPMQ